MPIVLSRPQVYAGVDVPADVKQPRPRCCFKDAAPTVNVPRLERDILPHVDAAYNLARWLTHDPVEAEDIVFEAFVMASEYPAASCPHHAKAQLLQIVRKSAYAKIRNKKISTIEEESNQEAVPTVTEDPATLAAAVSALPIDLRECLILHEIEKFSYKEIARITGVSVSTVMSRLSQARCLLIGSWIATSSE